MAMKESRGYYRVFGHYMFMNLISGEGGIATGYSSLTAPEHRWEKFPILREEAIDFAKSLLSRYYLSGRKVCKSEWFLEEILEEQWQWLPDGLSIPLKIGKKEILISKF